MDEQTWYSIKAKYPIGAFVRGKVIQHQPEGILLDMGEPGVQALIRIGDFVDVGEMRADLYPPIGAIVGGIICANSDSKNAQINLSTKPSLIHDFLMHLRKQDEIDPTYLQNM